MDAQGEEVTVDQAAEDFARLADEALNAGKSIWRRWRTCEKTGARTTHATTHVRWLLPVGLGIRASYERCGWLFPNRG
ncbi:hypothetical protein ACFVAG_25525 [Streptomyces sp. NPDC057644]|uniref:hypothetical protein n=1 Tax=Streptomyces sp. NPDC057644 TaxID=3346191 RepID=UPI00368E2AAD